jgi:hypothetical protein
LAHVSRDATLLERVVEEPWNAFATVSAGRKSRNVKRAPARGQS